MPVVTGMTLHVNAARNIKLGGSWCLPLADEHQSGCTMTKAFELVQTTICCLAWSLIGVKHLLRHYSNGVERLT